MSAPRPTPQTSTCQWCQRPVRVVPCAGFLTLDDHKRPETGRTCPGTGVVVGYPVGFKP